MYRLNRFFFECTPAVKILQCTILTLSLLGYFEGFWPYFFFFEVNIENFFFLAHHKPLIRGPRKYDDIRGAGGDGEDGKIGSYTTQKFDFLNLFIFRAFFWVFLRVLLFEQHPSRDRVKMIRFTSDFGKNSRISRLHSRARNALNFHKSNLAFRVNQQVFSFKPCLISSNILLLRSSNFRHFVLIYAHAFGFRAHCNDFTMLLNTVFSWIEEAAASIFFLSKKKRLLFEGGFYSRAASIKFEYLKGRNFREWPLGYCVLFLLPSLELFIYE